ncbi:MAG: hypothetical protein RLZZ175_2412 [Bacteroidota bacterium]
MNNINSMSNKVTQKSVGVFEFSRFVSSVQFIAGFIFVSIPLIALYAYYGNPFYSIHGEEQKLFSYEIFWDRVEFIFKSKNATKHVDLYFIIISICLYISFGLAWRNFYLFFKGNYSILIDNNSSKVTINANGKNFNFPFSEIHSFKVSVYEYVKKSRRHTVYILQLIKNDGYAWELKRSENQNEIITLHNQLVNEIQLKNPNTSPEIIHTKIDYFETSVDGLKVLKMNKFPSYLLLINTFIFVYVSIKCITLFKIENLDPAMVIPLIFFCIASYILILFWKTAFKQLFYHFELNIDDKSFKFYRISRISNQKILVTDLPFESIDRILIAPVQTKYFLDNTGLGIIAKSDVETYTLKEIVSVELQHSIGISLFFLENEIEHFEFEKYLQDYLKSKGYEVK